MEYVTAAEMAREVGVDPKRFRAALRAEGWQWHAHGEFWTVARGGSEHRQMKVVLARLKT